MKRLLIVLVVLMAFAAVAEQIPSTLSNFSTGTTISSSTMNAHFDAVETAVDDNADDIDGLQAGTGITALDVDVITGDSSDDDDLDVAAGGTGVSTLTDGGVLLGSGTGDITATAVLTEGQLLIGDGTTDPAIAAMSGDATIASTGALTIAAGAVEASMVAADVATQAELDAKSAASSTDNAITRFDSTAGDIQNSGVTIDDSDNVTIPGDLTVGTSGGTCLMLRNVGDTAYYECGILNGTDWSCTSDADGVCDGA